MSNRFADRNMDILTRRLAVKICTGEITEDEAIAIIDKAFTIMNRVKRLGIRRKGEKK